MTHDRPTAEQERYARMRRERGEMQADLREAMYAYLRGVEPTGAAARIYIGCGLPEFELLSTVRLASTSDDWPLVLADTFQKRLLDYYFAGPRPAVRVLTRRVNFRDVKPATLLRVGEYPELKQVGEGGEVLEGTIADGGETLQLLRFARIFSLSQTAFANDDTGAFNEMAEAAAQAVAFCEGNLFFSVLLSNSGAGPTLLDGTAFFDASRSNLLAGAALDASELGLALAALRKQTAPGGAQLNLPARYLLVGPDNEATALGVVATLKPAGTALEVVVDAHLTSEWYVFADPARRPAFVRGRLQNQGPPSVQANTWPVEGVRWKVSTTFGIAGFEPRAAVRNPGP